MAGDSQPLTGRVLIAGVGNIFLGDDGFGPQVASRLGAMDWPAGVRVADYGIGGMHLAYDLAEGYDTAILIDAAATGGTPGSISVTEVAAGERHRRAAGSGQEPAALFDGHGMQPDVVLATLDVLGARAGRIIVVGCEPASVGYRMGLSEPVAAAVDEAVRTVIDLVAGAACADPPRGHHHARAAPATGQRSGQPAHGQLP
jgi:hydrogenase maturation protease